MLDWFITNKFDCLFTFFYGVLNLELSQINKRSKIGIKTNLEIF